MAKRTKKVGVVGKYGTRYGASIRKVVKKIEISQHQKYMCDFCGKVAVKRVSMGIWFCRASNCQKTIAGGAWQKTTASAMTVKQTINRLRKMQLETAD
ncbi:unnamed protein product [Vitrella brassicaformis CCMP3155]|uniref:Ribosomal protein L37a n=1 Tax=Vitrella brassicaformis (strain CCMP3155) TaxID=1169540 RepID=A0A0G4ETA4_VITBC|nr:unnamed protein product [Vitrella brassicaformis CCMP3155]|mmetsp:Transcript_30648/g.76092  ORF Transcript_30648/g.76092 Transcript_30648/m.76092 type:complete len:98 (-) Transcript_30648:233-526(-)|eukprot:CEM01833.1 unnamed protein product [Vitrella brassicaformis CCMP3155]